jgi:AcrR family transcriptional regulator
VSTSDPQTDGRRKRADANRRRIALAMLELVRAGETKPSADQVAEAAGVGRRTVFRLFARCTRR